MQVVLTPSRLQAESISRSPLSVEIKTVDPLTNGADWDQLVLIHPDATIFHSSAWAKVLSKTYGHQPFYLHVSYPAGSTVLIPLMEIRSAITGRRGVCVPFSDCCAPLVSDVNSPPMAHEPILSLARERRWKYVELRGGDDMMPASASPAVTFYGHSLPLTLPLDDLWLGCSSSVRRGVRKATQNGLKVQITDERDAITQFFKLHTKTRRRHGLPPQPLTFFLSIYEEVVKAGHGFVVLGRKESRVVSAAIFFKFGRNALYKFGASDNAFQELRGNNLTMWEGIKYLAQAGCERLHLGRTSVDNDGLRHFKLGWGTAEEKLNYFAYDLATQDWKKSARDGARFHHKIFGNLPLSVNRLAGTLIYPHLD
jgi:hypothetical protein